MLMSARVRGVMGSENLPRIFVICRQPTGRPNSRRVGDQHGTVIPLEITDSLYLDNATLNYCAKLFLNR